MLDAASMDNVKMALAFALRDGMAYIVLQKAVLEAVPVTEDAKLISAENGNVIATKGGKDPIVVFDSKLDVMTDMMMTKVSTVWKFENFYATQILREINFFEFGVSNF